MFIKRALFFSCDQRLVIFSKAVMSERLGFQAKIKSSLRRPWFIAERIRVFSNLMLMLDAHVTGL